MKYGILFLTLAALLLFYPIVHGSLWWILLWPAASFALVGLAYVKLGPMIFGKDDNGRLAPFVVLVLLPYLLYLWTIWYLVRIFRRENAYDEICPDLVIGRRLLSFEVPERIEHVIDLTCEFNESKNMSDLNYYSFPILDGSTPDPTKFGQWLDQVVNLPGKKYIHCAEGHGRTGLFAAAYLVKSGRSESVDEALEVLKGARPLLRLGSKQLAYLTEWQRATNSTMQRGRVS